MNRNQHRRLAIVEARTPVPERHFDLSHLTLHQLEIMESCGNDDGHWDRDAIVNLSPADAEALLAAFQSIDGAGYERLRVLMGILYSKEAKARLDRVVAAANSRAVS